MCTFLCLCFIAKELFTFYWGQLKTLQKKDNGLGIRGNMGVGSEGVKRLYFVRGWSLQNSRSTGDQDS